MQDGIELGIDAGPIAVFPAAADQHPHRRLTDLTLLLLA